LSDFIEFVLFVLVAWLVARFVLRLAIRNQPSGQEPGDFEGKLAKIKPRPKHGAGAVALAEPDEEDEGP
jgi:hypothetical protein